MPIQVVEEQKRESDPGYSKKVAAKPRPGMSAPCKLAGVRVSQKESCRGREEGEGRGQHLQGGWGALVFPGN